LCTNACVVVVITLVPQKAAVVKQVARTAPKAYLNVRTPTELDRVWRVPTDTDSLVRIGWRVADHWEPDKSSIRSSTCVRPPQSALHSRWTEKANGFDHRVSPPVDGEGVDRSGPCKR
jgi:hypothetical protein